jgi:hypothetical protein
MVGNVAAAPEVAAALAEYRLSSGNNVSMSSCAEVVTGSRRLFKRGGPHCYRCRSGSGRCHKRASNNSCHRNILNHWVGDDFGFTFLCHRFQRANSGGIKQKNEFLTWVRKKRLSDWWWPRRCGTNLGNPKARRAAGLCGCWLRKVVPAPHPVDGPASSELDGASVCEC